MHKDIPTTTNKVPIQTSLPAFSSPNKRPTIPVVKKLSEFTTGTTMVNGKYVKSQ